MAKVIPNLSISYTVAIAELYLTELSRDNTIFLLLTEFNFLLSLILIGKVLYLLKCILQAVATIGPAQEPLPASSIPIKKLFLFIAIFFSII